MPQHIGLKVERVQAFSVTDRALFGFIGHLRNFKINRASRGHGFAVFHRTKQLGQSQMRGIIKRLAGK